MKAKEITKGGYYWYQDDGAWEVIQAIDVGAGAWTFALNGTELGRDASELAGEFLGPIAPPDDNSAADRILASDNGYCPMCCADDGWWDQRSDVEKRERIRELLDQAGVSDGGVVAMMERAIALKTGNKDFALFFISSDRDRALWEAHLGNRSHQYVRLGEQDGDLIGKGESPFQAVEAALASLRGAHG